MKTILKLSLLLILIAFIAIGCSEKNITMPGQSKDGPTSNADLPRLQTFPIIAGQNINAGNLSVWNDSTYFYVKFETTGGWVLEETQVMIDDDLEGYWIHDNGTPVPGLFDYGMQHNPPVTMYQYNIPRSYYTYAVGDTILIAAHCVVSNPDYNGQVYDHETGWGGDIEGPGPRWWYYLHYVIEEGGDNPPEPEYQVETAMMRMYDVPDDFTYRWTMGNGRPHAWFSYVKATPDTAHQMFYFYAGQHYKCGEVEIWKEGGDLKIMVNMINGWGMRESHLNISLEDFVGSPAFGLFPYCADHDPIAMNYTYTIPWDDEWNDEELDIALHADVQRAIMRLK
jgi:hypothetical protein